MTAILEIDDLHLEIRGMAVLRGVDLTVNAGQVHGLVGETGAGKSMVGRAVLDILPGGAKITDGILKFGGLDLANLPGASRRRLLGRRMSLIPQDPMSALNPVYRIGRQLTDILRHSLSLSRSAARLRALELLDEVRISAPERVFAQYPHELSGGMRQRVLIAGAFACRPEFIIADEPTTALDVTVQREVLRLIRQMQRQDGTGMLFVTHDLGVVAKICDWVSVIHSGRIVENGPAEQIFRAPQHPYTKALFAATPRYDRPSQRLTPVPRQLTRRLRDDAAAYDQRRRAMLRHA
ncbi:MAG: ABC transporter ATP-binding protein [Alphaproteobacteria bacterium]